MIFLDDSTQENGCLTTIPGSHKWGPRNHLFAKAQGTPGPSGPATRGAAAVGDGRLHVLEIGRVAPTPASVSAPLMAVLTRHPSCSGASIAPVTTPPAAARNVVRSLRAAQRNRAAPSHGAWPASTWCAGLASKADPACATAAYRMWSFPAMSAALPVCSRQCAR